MIVDTSALIAIIGGEAGTERLAETLVGEDGFLPTPVFIEFHRVVSRNRSINQSDANEALGEFLSGRLRLLPFTDEHSQAAVTANLRYGIGSARGGTLNLLNLMVYGCAKVTALPILCTGRDFAATDAAIHPASRVA